MLVDTTIRRKDGSYLQVEVHQQAQKSENDWIMVGVARDLTERKESAQRLHQLTHYDVLTGLPNRTLFYEALKNALIQATDSDGQLAVLFVDLDLFKNVNDTLGHTIGDELLSQFSDR